ncbi:MAG TPA: DUF2059 domain-containing protein, partial [Caldimonas sp.]
MKRLMMAALLAGAALANAQTATKKELVQKLLVLQQPGIEQVARGLVERPAMQIMQEAGLVLQRQVAPDKREAMGKQVEAEVKKYIDESVPLVRERAIKLGPTTIGPVLEEKFSEEELKQLIAWFESPVNKKYQQLGPEMQNAFIQKLLVEARPVVDPKLQALDGRLRTLFGAPPAAAAASAPSAPISTRAPASAPKAPAK